MKRMEVVNRMLMTKVIKTLNLEDIEMQIPKRGEFIHVGKRIKPVTSLRKGRPTMLTWRVQKEKALTLLFFPNGTIQCVGNSCDSDVQQMHIELCKVLNCEVPEWEVKSMTVLCILNNSCDFRYLSSNKNVTYEIELFPAVQMNFWKNIHVHAFHNGKLIITGITNVDEVMNVVNDVIAYLNSINKGIK